MIPVYEFDDKYTSDVDGFSFSLAAWLGDTDSISSTPAATVSPAGATIQSVVLVGTLVTVWVAGGTVGQAYTIEIAVATAAGRNCRVRGTFGVDA